MEIIEELSGKKALQLSKPSDHLNDFIKAKLGPFDPKKVLFIGDV